MPTKKIFQTNWKKTQSEAFNFADENEYDLIIARKYTNAKGYEFDAIPSKKFNKLIEYADENKESQLISTIIREGQHDKMRLDIEIYLSKKSYIKKAESFLDELIDDISEYADIDSGYFESDNSRESDQKEGYIYKFSKHIFFNYYFETGKHQKEFWRKFLLKFPDYKSITTNKMLFEFDSSVYEKNSQWNETKRKSDRSLIDRCPTIIDYHRYNKIDVEIDSPVIEVKQEIKKEVDKVETIDIETDNNKSNVMNDNKIPNETLEEIKKLCDMLSNERISNYNSWIKLIFCLASISTHKDLKKIALNTSGRSEKSNKKDFEQLFNSLWKLPTGSKYTIGTLYYWAKNDSPKKYDEFIKTKFTSLKKECLLVDDESDTVAIINKLSSNLTDRGIAHSLYQILKDKIKVTNKSKVYVINKNNIWVTGEISDLDKILSFDIAYFFTKLYYQNIAINPEKVSEEEYEFNKKCSVAMGINMALMNAKTYNAIKTFLVPMLTDLKFEEKLDSNLDLFAFSDKVIDLRTKEVRSIKPNDYIGINTGYKYPTSNLKYVDEINEFFDKIHTNKQIKKYMFDVLSMALCGVQSEESIYTHSGKDGIGGSGKSKTFSLIKMVLGNYAYCMPNDILYSKSNYNAQAPRPDILNLRGKRFVWCSEPDAGQKLNMSWLKQITGGDILTARNCNSNVMIEFKPQLQQHILCNKWLSCDHTDGGFIRRNKVIQYSSKFIQDTDDVDEANNIFLADSFIEDRFKLWRDDFIRMLIDNYKHQSKITVPEVIKEFSQKYLDSNNQLIDFAEKYLTMTNNKKDFISVQEIKNIYEQDKDFDKVKLKDLILDCKLTFKKNFAERVKINSKDYRNVITGYKLKDNEEEDNDICLIQD
jgi:phage/plasmid-associated DNA primase